MRALLPVLLLVSAAGCIASPVDDGLGSTQEAAQASSGADGAPRLAALALQGEDDVPDDTFEVAMTDAESQVFLIAHPHEGPVSITLTVLRGVYEGLRLEGPDGSCRDADMGGGQVIPGSAPAAVTIDCGVVPFGHHHLALSVGFGTASGKITVRGADILLAGEGA